MRENVLERLRSGGVLLADGAMGTMLQSLGLQLGACPEAWNVEHPDHVRRIHEDYVRAGSELVLTNTFGGTRLRLETHGRENEVLELNQAAVRIAREAAGEERWVVGDMGPFGGFLAPYGDSDADPVYAAFLEQARALVRAGVDAILIETQLTVDEMQLAVRAAREAGAEIVMASFAFDRSGPTYRTLAGTTPEHACAAMEEADVDVFGVNCGKDVDMETCIRIVQDYRSRTAKPILAKPNAGQPTMGPSGLLYPETKEHMAALVPELVAAGASIVGGCCGTTPEHIARFRSALGHG